jgi:NIMA (never in mitosis gene a)-related kinase
MSSSDPQKKLSMSDFTIKKVIGEGGYGRAILCIEKATGTEVVIKEIAMANMSRQEQNEAHKETKILNLLRHPNIITYRGCFMQKNCLHIVMDFADGGDLFGQIQKAI